MFRRDIERRVSQQGQRDGDRNPGHRGVGAAASSYFTRSFHSIHVGMVALCVLVGLVGSALAAGQDRVLIYYLQGFVLIFYA